MAIRITGMYSGLDTESIINELASAQSYKKTKLVKAQKKFSWKQDAWKALNTKIYSFYQKLDDMRLQSSYMKKKTTVSNPNAVQVVSGESTVDGVHTLTVDKLAKRAYLTSGSLETKDGVRFRGGASLRQLGFKNADGTPLSGKININGALGQSVEIEVDSDTTIDEFVAKIKATGLNASFDEDNQRLFISSKDTGADANFSISANDAGGFQALAALGLLSNDTKSSEYKDYQKWASYYDDSATGGTNLTAAASAEKEQLIKDLAAARAKAYKEQDESLAKDNEALDKANDYNKAELNKLLAKPEYSAYGMTAMGASDYADWQDKLYDKMYGPSVPKKDDDGNEVKDEEGNTVMERNGGLNKVLTDAIKDLEEKQKNGASAADIEAAKKNVEDAQKEMDKANDVLSFVSSINGNDQKKKANQDTIDSHNGTYDTDGKATAALETTIRGEVDTKAKAAYDALNGGVLSTTDSDKMAHKIEGQNSVITLNGVEYTSYNNSITVNGMTITALEETHGDEVTLSTSTDTDGIYDMIKGLFTEYNALINEMDSLYNADAARDYEPLTTEEKEALSDDEIEEWEKKIKDSLLRRDSTLSTVASAMKSVMLQGVNVNGTQMYLSDFGIETAGYFKAKDNERNAYHILGDKEDPSSWEQAEGRPTLRGMIATDPDTVMDFFVGLTNNMHDELAKKMSATKLSSALTVYNDKAMKEEYDSYTDKIKKEEEKLNALMDKWYAKFSAMETALAKLESKNNSLSSLFGG
ncbi:MAG: flagellar filament capping protein FliD [Lachnospiraceae bacterium]